MCDGWLESKFPALARGTVTCNFQYNKVLSDSVLCFKTSSAETIKPDDMFITKSCTSVIAAFLNHYHKIYQLLDTRRCRIRHSTVRGREFVGSLM